MRKMGVFHGALAAFCIFAAISGKARAQTPPLAPPPPEPAAKHLNPAAENVFEELRKRAIEKSPDVQSAQANARQKGAQLYTAWARWLPSATLSLSQNKSKDQSFLTNGFSFGAFPITINEVNNAKWTLAFSAPIYQRSVHVYVEQSLAENRLAQIQMESQRGEFDWRLRQAFGRYILQLYKEATLKSSIQIARTNVKDAQVRFELGQNTKVDVLRAQANLASLEAKQITYRAESAGAFSDFLVYAGLTSKDLDDVGLGLSAVDAPETEIAQWIDRFAASEVIQKPIETYLNEDPARPLGERLATEIPDRSRRFRTIINENDLADAQAHTAMSSELPSLTATGSLYNQNADWGQAFSNTNTLSYAFALTLSVPVFSWGTTVSTFLQQHNAQQVARLKRERDVQQLKTELENDVLRVRALKKTVESSRLIVAQNQEISRLSQTSYRLGKSTLVELLQSDTDLTNSKLTFAQSVIDLSVLMRKLAWNLGVTQ